jgi:hypothetical protein
MACSRTVSSKSRAGHGVRRDAGPAHAGAYGRPRGFRGSLSRISGGPYRAPGA